MINVIPYPKKVIESAQQFTLPKVVTINCYCDEWFSYIQSALSEKLDIQRCSENAVINVVCNSLQNAEGYILNVKNNIEIYASSMAGIIYAVQTLKQLICFDQTQISDHCPCLSIEDEPKYGYRGMLLDVSRHFYHKEDIYKILDMLAKLKMNVLHMHLTDDNGWRVQIKKYPLLTEIGGKRNGTHIGSWSKPIYDETPHCGYYTQEDIKQIVNYAQALNIQIIPEIDMPAHFRAALAAYPDLACRKLERPVPWYFATPKDVPNSKQEYARIACAGKEQTYTFIFDIIDELAELFPSKYFHIGGDEAPKDEWITCPLCKQRMQKEGLKNQEELQAYFNNKVAHYLKSKGKTLICWNDAFHANNTDTDVICQYCAAGTDTQAHNHLQKGGKVLVSKFQAFYYDMCHKEVSLKNAFCYNIEKEFSIPNSVLGVECTLWTEWIPNMQKLGFQTFPRILACAEQGWCYQKSSYKNFVKRVDTFKKILQSKNIYYAHDIVVHAGPIKKEQWRAKWYKENTNIEIEYQQSKEKNLQKSIHNTKNN